MNEPTSIRISYLPNSRKANSGNFPTVDRLVPKGHPLLYEYEDEPGPASLAWQRGGHWKKWRLRGHQRRWRRYLVGPVDNRGADGEQETKHQLRQEYDEGKSYPDKDHRFVHGFFRTIMLTSDHTSPSEPHPQGE